MDRLSSGPSPNNVDKVRGRTPTSKSSVSRDSSMSSTKSLVAYHERMENNNNMDVNNISSELANNSTQEKSICVSEVTNTRNSMGTTSQQRGSNENPKTTPMHGNDVGYNVPLLYDLNGPTEPKLWNRNFYLISLHESMEYLASDAKSIKDSLAFMAKYMGNKQLDPTRSNEIKDFKGIGEAIWSFISSVYQAKWNMLTADKNGNSLRQKISDKLTPRVIPPTNHNNKPVDKSTPTTMNKMPPLYPSQITEGGQLDL